MKPSLYFHTLRHLRPGQIAWRLYYKLHRQPMPPSTHDLELRPHDGPWESPGRVKPRLVGPEEIELLNERREIGARSAWNDSAAAKLWLYNLHYFEDLNARKAHERTAWHRRLIQRWIHDNPPTAGVAWEPYPVSLRIINWIKWVFAGNRLEPAWANSLAIQSRHLTRRLERHLGGNHLFANAKALTFAGLFFQGAEPDGWHRLGARMIQKQLAEQVLPDGANFELSTMYHALCLVDLLDLVNVHRAFGRDTPEVVSDAIPGAIRWLADMCHPDGEISFFNDAALGIAPPVEQIFRYAHRLGFKAQARGWRTTGPGPDDRPRLVDHPHSGYSRVTCGEAVAMVDRAAVGPDFLPGHAHADSLSFELSLFGRRVIVNSGTSVYGTGPERQAQRGTAAHATVVVDGQNSSETWAGFRVARRARISRRSHTAQGQSLQLTACHNGYQRLPGRPMHCRSWVFEGRTLAIQDRITGCGVHTMDAVFPLHPGVTVVQEEGQGWRLEVDGHPVGITMTGEGTAMVAGANFHPEFGISQANSRLVFRCRGPLPLDITTVITW